MKGPVEFHPRLVEEAVWIVIRRRRDAGLFHRERERLYGEPDPEKRERAFARLYLSWFRRLNLEEPITRTLGDEAPCLAAARRVLLVPATSERREAAELYVAAPGEFSVVIALRPETLAERDAALAFLRRELLHVADMLDPAFEYEPRLPAQPAGPAHDMRLQERYRVLWSCSIDGRLARLGRIPSGVRDAGLREFHRTFACLGERAEECFERLFTGPRPRHVDLVALAAEPETAFGLRSSDPSRSGRCPLCAFPTADLEPTPDLLPPDVVGAIVSEFPEWKADLGLCPQCADLYRARPLFAQTIPSA